MHAAMGASLPIRSRKAAGVMDWAPSHRAFLGSLWTSMMRPSAPAATAVFEDALFAVRTAKEAGFYTVGIYDPSGAAHWAQVQLLADETVTDWADALNRL